MIREHTVEFGWHVFIKKIADPIPVMILLGRVRLYKILSGCRSVSWAFLVGFSLKWTSYLEF